MQRKELHIAPMLAVSTPEFRYFHRLLSRHTIIWTEMVVDETLVHAPDFPLEYAPNVIIQLGGNNPDWTRQSMKIIQQAGFAHVNLNAGCPSHRVATARCFGAALLKDVDTAISMLQAMQETFENEISIKMRIAVDELQGYEEFLYPFVQQLYQHTACRQFFLHARKVHTQGLNPAQNRTIPPLDYSVVYRLCRDFPDCDFWVNGGIRTLRHAKEICRGVVDVHHHGSIPCALCQQPHGSCIAPPEYPAPPNLRGCMLGRAAMDDPARFATADTYFFGATENPTQCRRELLDLYCQYIEERYPRRCCDDHPTTTMQDRAPDIEHTADFCPICDPHASIHNGEGDHNGNDKQKQQKPTMKMSSRAVDASIKPIFGVFFNLRGAAKSWKRTLNNLSRDPIKRNCGPAFLIRQAMLTMPDELLDQPWQQEEDVI